MAKTILVVDDSVLTRTAIKRIIQMVDIEVDQIFEAGNGAEALEVLDREQIDLVLADLNMPQMNGIELVHHMQEKECYSRIPVVVVSTESSSTRIDELLEEGIKGYLHKPFQPEDFREIISQSLEK
jgi:two-component system chemotaxis response regulator CheY